MFSYHLLGLPERGVVPVPEESALDDPVDDPVEFSDQRRVTLEADANAVGRKAFLWRERERKKSNLREKRALKKYSNGSTYNGLHLYL